MDNLNAAQGVMGLRRRYGDQRVEAACERALRFGTPYYKSVKQILERGLDVELATVASASSSMPDVYAGKSVFCRDHKTLIVH